ncbi:hypothetical protein HPP92_000900 [Vanilla planifolia]|uniref:Uncharacterized protein n=1 Tax=Vanilla planifolia TaxID=51239 RepID=A0A835VD27_VANPL|nr:hypothetical protein HPP92_000900 [Vanilla planifolia]
MAFDGGEGLSLLIGGKGSHLSSADVYAISRGLRKATIDPAALDKLSRSKASTTPPPSIESSSVFLTLEESRAALVVLLNKFLLSDAAVRPTLPLLIEQVLGLRSGHESVDFGSPHALITSLCCLSGKGPDDVGRANRDEIFVIERSAVPLVGILSILDCCLSALTKLSDVVAALSCEVARADAAVFDISPSGDGLSIKDETDVGGDMKALLFGSKLVGQSYLGAYSDIPAVHGSFRGALRSLHGRARVELNSSINARKAATGAVSHSREKALVAAVLPLALSIQSMSEISLARAKSCAASLNDQELQNLANEEIEKTCALLDALKVEVKLVLENSVSDSDSAVVLHYLYEIVMKFRKILAWEMAIAMYVIEIDDSIGKPELGEQGGTKLGVENGKLGKEKKRRKH